MSAFSPTVNAPSELISPSSLPSIKSSFWNLIVPLISTSLERTSLPECSAINFLYSFVEDFGWSPYADRLESSPPELSDPSSIDEIVFCGMNFLNTRYYCNGYSHCQRVRERKAEFFTIYPQNGTILRSDSGRKEPETVKPARASDQGSDRSSCSEQAYQPDRS